MHLLQDAERFICAPIPTTPASLSLHGRRFMFTYLMLFHVENCGRKLRCICDHRKYVLLIFTAAKPVFHGHHHAFLVGIREAICLSFFVSYLNSLFLSYHYRHITTLSYYDVTKSCHVVSLTFISHHMVYIISYHKSFFLIKSHT